MICLKPFRFPPLVFHDPDPQEIKVVYDHTRIASYRHLPVGNVGGEYGYWLLRGNECCSAGGFPNNPVLSGPRRTVGFKTSNSLKQNIDETHSNNP